MPELDSIDPRAAASLLGAEADFPDRRLFTRLPKLISSLISRLRAAPSRTTRAARRGALRWLHNRRLHPRALLSRVRRQVCLRVPELPVLVVPHDTSEIDKHGRGAPSDAGPLRSSQARGYLAHFAALATLDGALLGGLDAWAWTRPWTPHGQHDQGRAMLEKESCKWDHGVARAERLLRAAGFQGEIWHPEDREADIFEHLVHQTRKGRKLVVRADLDGRPRNVLDERPERTPEQRWRPMEDRLAELSWSEAEPVQVDSRATDRARGQVHHIRQAQVAFRFCAVTLKPSKRYEGTAFRQGLPLWVVEVQEQDPPADVEPLHWLLWSLAPVKVDEDARLVIAVYKVRWKAEDLLKVCKSACHLEDQYVSSLTAFKRLLAVVMALATHLTQVVTLAREEPDRPAKDVVEPADLQATREAASYYRVPWPRGRVSLGTFLELVARIGGYEVRKTRRPGQLVIYRGWTLIQEHQAIAEHARAQAGPRLKKPRNRGIR